jgi:hypothetical protein
MAAIRHKMGHWSSDFPRIDPDVRIRPRHDRGGEDRVHVHVDVPSDPVDRSLDTKPGEDSIRLGKNEARRTRPSRPCFALRSLRRRENLGNEFRGRLADDPVNNTRQVEVGL